MHKKGAYEPQNFRPVCQLSGFSKLIEKCAHKQFSEYCEQNFDDRFQFSYKKFHQCQDAVLLARHTIEQKLSENKFVLVILIDLSLAFDTVSTRILSSKLKHYGADTKSLSFFDSFFNKRKHYVLWNGNKSKTNDLFDLSVCQGSCIGSLMFNSYVRDYKYVIGDGVEDGIENCGKIHAGKKHDKGKITSDGVFFADDSFVILAGNCAEKLIQRGNEKLKQTSTYMNANKLILNEKKTQFLLYKPKGKRKVEIKTKLSVNNQEIEQVKHARYLGVIFDEELTFKEHFNKVKSKLMEGVKALRCTRLTLNFRAKFLLYNGYFRSHVEFCAITYLDKLNKK